MSFSAKIFGLAFTPLTVGSFALKILNFIASIVASFGVFIYY
jgi:hypothetical protein